MNTLNETIADLARQLEQPNGQPLALYMPLIKAIARRLYGPGSGQHEADIIEQVGLPRGGVALDDGDTVTLDAEAVTTIRRALVTGLASYGEVERLQDYAALLKHADPEFPLEAVPVHPTGSNDTIGEFACALAYLN